MCWFSSAWHRSTVRCIFEKLSGHKKLKDIDNEIDFSGLKGWEDSRQRPQEIVSSLPLVTA